MGFKGLGFRRSKRAPFKGGRKRVLSSFPLKGSIGALKRAFLPGFCRDFGLWALGFGFGVLGCDLWFGSWSFGSRFWSWVWGSVL